MKIVTTKTKQNENNNYETKTIQTNSTTIMNSATNNDMVVINIDNDTNTNTINNNIPNNDIENPPVVVVEPAKEADYYDTDADGTERTNRCVKQICYSPFYYYYKLVLCLIGLASALYHWLSYTNDCPEWKDAMLPKAFFYTVFAFYGWIFLAHAFFIVARYVTKHPPSDDLYDGKFASILKLPLMISYVILLVLGIVGLVAIHAPASESQACAGELKSVMITEGIGLIIIQILMLLRISGLRKKMSTCRK